MMAIRAKLPPTERGSTLTIFVDGDEPNLLSHPLKITNYNETTGMRQLVIKFYFSSFAKKIGKLRTILMYASMLFWSCSKQV